MRAPARAQDLILRHRVTDYRAGDLDREYEPLGLEEDHLFVYGFLPHATWRLLHPRSFDEELSDLERGIIAAFEAEGSLDSRALEERFGAGRGMNPWGSYSRATQLALDHLHQRGLLRVVRRDRGNRVYALTPAAVEALPGADRLRELALIAANLLAPLPKTTFSHVVTRIRHSMRTKEVTAASVVKSIVEDGLIVEAKVDGMPYLLRPGATAERDFDEVRIFAPFDPV
ncbi:MAG: crosslink repair DNA glycosylase YcaQ family protein, partial [Dehalococcoidia bacterium]